MLTRRSIASLALALLVPVGASAQSTSLSQLTLNLFDITLAPTPIIGADGTPKVHEAHFTLFERNQGLVQGDNVPITLNQSIVSQLTTLPLGSSSGGFTWRFSPETGTFNRATESFGSAFAERGLTLGRNKFDFGMNYVHTSFNQFQGKDLSNGDMKLYMKHDVTTSYVGGDVIQAALSLDLRTDAFAFFANYGVTNRLDVGVAIPILRVAMDATMDATIERLATGSDPTPTHFFVGGGTQKTFSQSGTASGIGDIVLRGKYNFFTRPGVDMAAGLDVRLPTGDDANLLGAGATQTRVYYILSGGRGRFSPHVNIGYTFASKQTTSLYVGQLPNEMNYTAGLDAVISPKVTVAFDVVGRALRDTQNLVVADQRFDYVNSKGVAGSTTYNTFDVQQGTLNLAMAAFGAKVNLVGRLLLSAQLLVPMTNNGLHARPTPIIGFDYGF